MSTLLNKDGSLKSHTLVLSSRSYIHYGEVLYDKDTLNIKTNLNSADEISFTAYKELNGKKTNCWDKLTDLRLIWVKELNEYFQIECPVKDSMAITKSVSGRSLCEEELSQTILYDTYINTEDDIARDDYKPTKFYDPSDPSASLLHRVLSKAPHYKIKHVDLSLYSIQRAFSIDGTSIYDFLTGECADEFHCLFQFDSTDRSISVYDLETTCSDCGYRGDFTDVCPKCGSTNLSYYGEDTTVSVSKDNLSDEIDFSTDVDSIKNCFKLKAGDDLMTATIASINPNGSSYIYYIPQEQKDDMSEELVDRLDSYDKFYASCTKDYSTIIENLYDCIDKILYYTSSMMPTIEQATITASTEAVKLTSANLSPLGLSSVLSTTSVATVNSALKNYAKVYVKYGYVKIEIENGKFVYGGKNDGQGNSYGTWTGRFKVTNYSDEDDIAYSQNLTIKVYDNYYDFLNQKIQKSIANSSKDDEYIYNVLTIKDLDQFKQALTYYALNRLTSFYDAVQSCLDVLVEAQQGDEKSELYSSLYVPYYNKLQACQAEIDTRQETINQWITKRDSYEIQVKEIQKNLNFPRYLGTDLYLEFCSYKREDTYSNDNYISDGLSNTELIDKAEQFLSVAKKEIVKSGEYQHSITSTLYNLLAMKEFQPIVDKFKLGNWIRLRVDNDIYRLRLIGYELSASDITKLNVTFSDVTKTANGMNDINSILKSSQSIASSYNAVTNQAESGKLASDTFEKIQKEGFDSGLYRIKNADDEVTIFDKHGLLCRSYDDVLDDYSPEQFILTHNVLAFTDDNWEHLRAALGKQNYTLNGVKYEGYGLNADFCIASMIIGATINNGNSTFTVDPNGNMTATSATIKGTVTAGSGSSFGRWKVTDACIYRDNPTFANQNSMYFGDNGLSLSNQFYVDKDGAMTSTSGHIGGFKIGDTQLCSDSNNVGMSSSTSDWAFWAGDVITGTDRHIFCASHDGTVWAKNIRISGGELAGWVIDDTAIYNDQADNIGVGMSKYGRSLAFWAGANIANADNAPFRVTHTGELYATGAHIKGDIEMTNGYMHIISSLGADDYITLGRSNSTRVVVGTDGFASYEFNGYTDEQFEAGSWNRGLILSYSQVKLDSHNSGGDLVTVILENGKGVSSYGWDSYSDERLKHNVGNLDIQKSAEFIFSLQAKRYIYKYRNDDIYDHGFIAQDVKKLLGSYDNKWSIVSHSEMNGEDYLSLNYQEFIPDIIATLQSINERLIRLEGEKNG